MASTLARAVDGHCHQQERIDNKWLCRFWELRRRPGGKGISVGLLQLKCTSTHTVSSCRGIAFPKAWDVTTATTTKTRCWSCSTISRGSIKLLSGSNTRCLNCWQSVCKTPASKTAPKMTRCKHHARLVDQERPPKSDESLSPVWQLRDIHI